MSVLTLKISDFVCELRQQLDLSQEKFAAELGVSLLKGQPLGERTCSTFTNGAEAN